jgi:ATP-dependent metalloprotease
VYPFSFCQGSQSEEVYIGLGTKHVRLLFESAKKKSSIICIDAIDAVGGLGEAKRSTTFEIDLE